MIMQRYYTMECLGRGSGDLVSVPYLRLVACVRALVNVCVFVSGGIC